MPTQRATAKVWSLDNLYQLTHLDTRGLPTVSSHKLNRSNYFSYARRALGDRGETRLRHQMSFLYQNTEFLGKRVLDIGGGSGRHTFFAAASGAAEVRTIEPESDGGHHDMHDNFQRWRDALGASNTQLIDTTIQEFVSDKSRYDIVLVQDAINHFDESACIDLQRSEASRLRYSEIFRTISDLVEPGGQLILSDCSSRNFFPSIGLSNPFDPAIEWHKHQTPETWARLAQDAALRAERLRWSSPTRLGMIGSLLFGNRLGAYFFTSHFVLDFRKLVSSP